jgi:2-hydroxy-3-keto-5-methylthiopentenyl-1-phosphate phosphatase
MTRIVFCDFDGTITSVETFVAILKEFAPEISQQLMPQIYAQTLTLRQGVRQMLESIPSRRYPEILEFTRSQPMRDGFVELLDFLHTVQVPLVVVSGGLQGMIEVVLGDLVHRVKAIHAITVDASQEYLQISSPYEDGTEIVAKVKVIEKYGATEAIAIGDSITDLNMALHVPLVFARDRLATYLDQQQKSYIPWHDFLDVRDYLAELWLDAKTL